MGTDQSPNWKRGRSNFLSRGVGAGAVFRKARSHKEVEAEFSGYPELTFQRPLRSCWQVDVGGQTQQRTGVCGACFSEEAEEEMMVLCSLLPACSCLLQPGPFVLVLSQFSDSLSDSAFLWLGSQTRMTTPDLY